MTISLSLTPQLKQVLEAVKPVGEDLTPRAQHKIDVKTKPPGSLGRLEELAVQMCCIQGSLDPRTGRKALFVFAGDHGVAEEGVSAFPTGI